MCQDLVPFEAVNKEGFTQFMNYYLPGFPLPTSTTLSTSALTDIYTMLKKKVSSTQIPG